MISLPHRSVYVHVPKCGGQSIEQAFCADLGLDWEKHRRLLMMFRRPKAPVRWKGRTAVLAHLTADEYLRHDYIPRDLWQSYFTFATVRNPFKLIESRYFYTETKKFPDFERFILNKISKGKRGYRFRPQTSYLVDEAGAGLVKRVYMLEHLGQNWGDIRERSGVSTDLPHNNRSNREPVLWTEEMRDVVRRVYADDFERLGYNLDDGTPKQAALDFA